MRFFTPVDRDHLETGTLADPGVTTFSEGWRFKQLFNNLFITCNIYLYIYFIIKILLLIMHSIVLK